MRALREERLGRYELLLPLGSGGMAELFLARLQGVGGFEKIVAIKRILRHYAQDPQFKEMFLNEGRIAAVLQHPNVCQTFELDEVDGELYLAMEYLEGVSWDHVIVNTPRGWPALRLTACVLAQAAEGLHYAHSLHDVAGRPTPVIHRDVSPQNLFVTVDGVCKVLDFGVSKMMTDGPRTRTGVIKGKLPYMAPEQIRGDGLDGRADVFSLGVCAWEALAGRRLFDRSTDFAIWKAITEEDVPPIRAYWPECPPAVEAAILRALDRDRERRQPSARYFGGALCAAAGIAVSAAEVAIVAEAVRTSCGEKIMLRRQEVATAVSGKREAADTIKDGDMRLRSDVRRVERQAASTVDALPRAREVPSTADVLPRAREQHALAASPAAPRRSVVPFVVVAIVAAAIAAVVVGLLMKRDERPIVRTSADAAVETAEPAAAGETADPDAAVESEDPWGQLREGLHEVRKTGEELRKLRDELHGSN